MNASPSSETAAAGDSLASAPAEQFYADVLRIVKASGVPFLVGGTYAFNSHTRVVRQTKDLDIFCRAADYPRILEAGAAAGLAIEVLDERWIAKLKRDPHFVDVIFGSVNAVAPVSDQWFLASHQGTVLGLEVQVLPATELIWSKAFLQDRHRYDGSDIVHVILVKNREIDWRRLLGYFNQYWEVLLIHLLNFRFIYPSERDLVPRWLLDELLERLHRQRQLPKTTHKTCRGHMFSPNDYAVDLHEWGFGDIIG
jgi:hypothetical protein